MSILNKLQHKSGIYNHKGYDKLSLDEITYLHSLYTTISDIKICCKLYNDRA